MSAEEPAPSSTRAPSRIFFEGRYRKFVRDLPQTIFHCPQCRGRGCETCDGFGKLTRDSVQELIARTALPHFRAPRHAHKFHGAGREDMDVRMLGTGRPFVFEIDRARQPDADLEQLQKLINERHGDRIELLDLKWCARKRIVEVKESQHAKEYGLRVQADAEVDLAPLRQRLLERITLRQRTPQRVAHRRADLERERWIELREVEALPQEASSTGCMFRVTLRSEHGTYIKEFVSSDEGRTEPSLAAWLGAACRCVELDVLNLLDEERAPAAHDD